MMNTKKKNDYGWNLDSIAHKGVKTGAHYSKNWTVQDQRDYNKWYYENVTKKVNRDGRTTRGITNRIQKQAVSDETQSHNSGVLANILAEDHPFGGKEYQEQYKVLRERESNLHNSSRNSMKKIYNKYGAIDMPTLQSNKSLKSTAFKQRRADQAASNGDPDVHTMNNKEVAAKCQASLEQRKQIMKNLSSKKSKPMATKITEATSSTISAGKSAIDSVLSSVSSTVSNLTNKKTSNQKSGRHINDITKYPAKTELNVTSTWDDAKTY